MIRVQNLPAILGAMLVVSAGAFGCGEAGDGSPMTGPSTGDLPCDVQAILQEHCADCHGAEPRYGAPMGLVNLEDMMGDAITDDSRAVWEVVLDRIHDDARPMPPAGLMTDDERARLQAWVDDGHGITDEVCSDLPTPPVEEPSGPEHLPCEPTHTFQAFGDEGADSAYALNPEHSNLIQCFVFDSPFTEDGQALAFAPMVDDSRVLHHWIIFGTASDELTAGTSFDCTDDMPGDASFIAGWAPGGGNNVLPDDIGFAVPGPGSKVLLQVHYWNVAGHADVLDQSGVAICASDEPVREHTAGVHILGALQIGIPPRSDSHSISGDCTPILEEPVHIMSSAPHMHNLGIGFQTEIFRGGDPDAAEMLIELDQWDFNAQGSYPTPTVVYPGDTLRTTCTYRNPSDQTVSFGERTEDEMCFNFISAYPMDQLVSPGFGVERGVCFDF